MTKILTRDELQETLGRIRAETTRSMAIIKWSNDIESHDAALRAEVDRLKRAEATARNLAWLAHGILKDAFSQVYIYIQGAESKRNHELLKENDRLRDIVDKCSELFENCKIILAEQAARITELEEQLKNSKKTRKQLEDYHLESAKLKAARITELEAALRKY